MSTSRFLPIAAIALAGMALSPIFAQSSEPPAGSDAPLAIEDIYAIENNAQRLEDEAIGAEYRKEYRKACTFYTDAASERIDAWTQYDIFAQSDSEETEEREKMASEDMESTADLLAGKRDLACLNAIKEGV